MAKYISAKYGSSSNGGTSLKDSLLSVKASIATGDYISYVYDGVYFEENIWINSFYQPHTIIGMGRVIFDGTLFNYFTPLIHNNYYGAVLSFVNLTVQNYLAIGTANNAMVVAFDSCYIHNVGIVTENPSSFHFTRVILDSSKEMYPWYSDCPAFINNCVITGTGVFNLYILYDLSLNDCVNNIWYKKPIVFSSLSACKVKFNHFYSCLINIGAVTHTYDNEDYNIDVLRDAAVTAFGGTASDYFPNCAVYNADTTDCFVNPTAGVKEGFYLKPTSPSASANYITGKHIGALPVARGPVFPTDYTSGSNIQADGTLLNPNDNTEANNTIEYTNPFDHGKIVLVEAWGEGIQDAPRNGDYDSLDRDTDIDANLLGDTAVLTNNEVYVCEIESLSITKTESPFTVITYAVGENCLVQATGTWTISATSGKMRKLFTDKRPTIMVKHSRTDATLATATYLKYYITPLNGTTLTYPMCLVDDSGIPVLGDADTGFVYTGHVRYGNAIRVQLRYEKRKSIIQVENAKS